MSSIDRIGRGNTEPTQPLGKTGLTEKDLPLEIISEIFTNLNNRDLQNTLLVDQSWSDITKDEAKRRITKSYDELKGIIDRLTKKAGDRNEILKSLNSILESSNVIKDTSNTTSQLQQHLNILCYELLDEVFKNDLLDHNELQDLQEHTKQETLKLTMSFAHIALIMDNGLNDRTSNDQILIDENIIKNKNENKSQTSLLLTATKIMRNPQAKQFLLNSIMMSSVIDIDFKLASEISQQIAPDNPSLTHFKNVMENLSSPNINAKKVEEKCDEITDNFYKIVALLALSLALIENNNIDHALVLSESFPPTTENPDKPPPTLRHFFKHLEEKLSSNPDHKNIDIAKSITHPIYGPQIRNVVATKFLEQALNTITNLVPNEQEKWALIKQTLAP